MHVLVCEDDELIASGIVAGLTAQGLTVEPVSYTHLTLPTTERV